jgi:hypothetical protein
MRHYFDDSCVACRSARAGIDGAARKGHHFIGDRFTIRSVEGLPSRSSDLVARVRFDVSSTEVVDVTDDYVDSVPALHDFQERVYAAWRRGSWVVTKMIPRAGR